MWPSLSIAAVVVVIVVVVVFFCDYVNVAYSNMNNCVSLTLIKSRQTCDTKL